ncbi:MAG TPA: hypothetical protein VM580_24435 [Labilithrix sp.]|nr:hypothetical protein [Labilithrix sp.]
MTHEILIREHAVRYEPDTGFLSYAFSGYVEESDILQMTEAMHKLEREHAPPDRPLFILVDHRKTTGVSSGARRASSLGRDERPVYVAMFGMSLALRTFLKIVLKGLQLVNNTMTATAVATDEEARAWLSERRRAFDMTRSRAG